MEKTLDVYILQALRRESGPQQEDGGSLVCHLLTPLLVYACDAWTWTLRPNKEFRDSRLRPWVRNLVAPPARSRWIVRYVADSKPVSVIGPIMRKQDIIHKIWST